MRNAILYRPDYIRAHNYLGIVLLEQGNPDEAAVSFSRAISLKPDYVDALYNLGNTLHALGNPDAAAEKYNQAITVRPEYAEAHYNLGVVLQDLNRLDEAAASYHRAIALKPNYAEVHLNLGTVFYSQGKYEEAFRSMRIAVESAPADHQYSEPLIHLLNNYMPAAAAGFPYIEAQKSLQQVSKEYTTTHAIADETVRELYRQCCNILAVHKLDLAVGRNQLFRGKINKDNCPRHLMVFNTFNIIPAYCFDCFKVTIEPRTVMDLFKLLFVFDKLTLPNDNPRKCIVEVRTEIHGTYKGFIYCRNLNEAQAVLNIVRPIINTTIAEKISVFVKRGCSEFQAAFPEYGQIADDTIKQKLYDTAWRKIEAAADKNLLIPPFEYPAHFSNNHSGFTLLDVLVMRNWLAYAKKIGDQSHLNIL